MLPKVAIIILTYNAKSTLGEIFDKAIMSALTQDYPNIEVIVVDNGSQDDTYEYVRDKYDMYVNIIKFDKNYGFCLGNNLALRYVSRDAKYILFQNPDVILATDYVRKLVEIMEHNSDVAAVQGLEMQPFTKVSRIGGLLNSAGFYVELIFRPSIQHSSEVLLTIGAAMLVRRTVFELIGGFPSDYFLYDDEADFGLRARALGFKLVGTSATRYIHFVSGTAGKLRELSPLVYYFLNRNRLLNIFRYFYGLYLLKALIINGIVMSFHLFTLEKSLKRALISVIPALFRYFKKNVEIRYKYAKLIKKRRLLEKFIVKWPVSMIILEASLKSNNIKE